MSKKPTNKGGLPLTTTYLCLVVALVIASATFAVQHIIEVRENANQTHPQHEELKSEEVKDQEVNSTLAIDSVGTLTPVVAEGQPWPDVSATGVNGNLPYDYCVLTGVVEPTAIQDIRVNDGNSIRIPAVYCKQLAEIVFRLVDLEFIQPEDILIIE